MRGSFRRLAWQQALDHYRQLMDSPPARTGLLRLYHLWYGVLDVQIDTTAPLESSWQPELLGGVSVVQAHGVSRPTELWSEESLYRPLGATETSPPQRLTLTAVPYYAWANREPRAVCVWIPRITQSSARRSETPLSM